MHHEEECNYVIHWEMCIIKGYYKPNLERQVLPIFSHLWTQDLNTYRYTYTYIT